MGPRYQVQKDFMQTSSMSPSYERRRLIANRLDQLSGLIFIIGILLAKLQYLIPAPPIALILNSIALGLYATAYLLWLLEAAVDPHQDPKLKAWYGFAKIQQQFSIASVIGLVGTAFGVGAIFMPILIIPCCALFTLSNIFWSIGEYQKRSLNKTHRKDHPEYSDRANDPEYSRKKQKAYFQYAMIATIMSAISSLLVITAFFAPSIAIYTLIGMAYIGGIVGKAWFDALVCKAEKKTEFIIGYTSTLSPEASPAGSQETFQLFSKSTSPIEPPPEPAANFKQFFPHQGGDAALSTDHVGDSLDSSLDSLIDTGETGGPAVHKDDNESTQTFANASS